MKRTTLLQRLGVLGLPVMLAAAPGAAVAQERATQEARETARQSGNAVTDSWLTMKIHSQFVPEDALEGSDIDVDTNAGVVTLTGTVPTDAARTRAVAIAKATDGVKSVSDKLRIAPSGPAAAREAGREAGAETRRAAGEAERDARETAGTAGRTVTDGWLKSKIYSQYITEDALEDADVDIDISSGAVTLNGTVATDAARSRAEAIAKGTDGVKSVKNNLKVAK